MPISLPGNISRQVARILETPPKRKSVTIIGSGWGGYTLFDKINRKDIQVDVVSPNNYFVFTPMLAGASLGRLDFSCITEPIVSSWETGRHIQAVATSIDFASKTISCTEVASDLESIKNWPINGTRADKNFNVSYDTLVITCGALVNTFNTPGVAENAFFIKDLPNATCISNRIQSCFQTAMRADVSGEEKNRLLHFAVVGGGPTGVEFVGELYDYINQDLARIYPEALKHVNISIFDVAPTIVGTMPPKCSEYASREYQDRSIQLRMKTAIKEVTATEIITTDCRQIPYGLLVWGTGITQGQFVTGLQVLKAPNGQIKTDKWLNVLTLEGKPIPDVYALGDCSTVEGLPLPATAQVANRKALYLAKRLSNPASSGGVHDKPFKYKDSGMMVFIGSHKAMVKFPLFNKEYIIKGFLGWVIWNGVYIRRQFSMRNKILILLGWINNALFGRKIPRL